MLKSVLTVITGILLLTIGAGSSAEDASSYQLDSIVDGDYAKAEQALLEVLKSAPNDPFALLNLAFIYQRYGEAEKARLMYDRILEQQDNPHAQLASGKAEPVKSIARKGLAMMEAGN